MSKSFELSPEEFERMVADKPRKRQGGNSSPGRRTYDRPAEDDIEAMEAWGKQKAPSDKKYLATLLVAWFGNNCGLCGLPIDMELLGTHPGRRNIDHIVPRRKDDPNDWTLGNLRLSHRACNMQRGDGTLPEPDDILYRELLAAAIDKFENPEHHVASEIERLRWRAATRTAMVGMETRMVAWNLENSTDEDFKARVRNYLDGYQRRADEALAELVAVQAELIAQRSRLE